MGRELKRVPIDFNWPLNKPWKGYINPFHVAEKCKYCDGTGASPMSRYLQNLWYGYEPFKPEDRGSAPFFPTDPIVVERARRNVGHSPEFYGASTDSNIHREAVRLCEHYNSRWRYHINDQDVAALIKGDRLWDLTRTFVPGEGWKDKVPAYIPTSREVNEWSICSFGHDSINCWIVIKAECKRLRASTQCAVCKGHGERWPSKEAKLVYDQWEQEEPPQGEGFQIWETVSEGSPISPVFATAEELAEHMAGTRWGGDRGTPKETWLQFINGPGWALSFVMDGGNIISGVEAVV